MRFTEVLRGLFLCGASGKIRRPPGSRRETPGRHYPILKAGTE
ncbi:hypothetical protein CLOSTASPAR_00345 [[Clostridium] asparagiforme DSM 15981]|uniref:Uncharacterized protein n=1 Tax=[Clostridium] asparagiforme DSM 15981 TaxID=518636 RepID=C0CTP7_9FIRM|nr:hypothetical protein CLOSTASPAR_00345 [[Clostridium] asparagiforme DSM 15981]